MSQDIISDALNQIMNAKRVEKTEVEINRFSNVLINLFNMMKQEKHIDFKIEGTKIIVTILKLNECKAIKPRFYVQIKDIDKYLRRFLPSRNFGILVISTNKGLMDQEQAYENNKGGSLIAYFY